MTSIFAVEVPSLDYYTNNNTKMLEIAFITNTKIRPN